MFFNRPLMLYHYMQNVKDGGKWRWTPVGVVTLILQFSKQHNLYSYLVKLKYVFTEVCTSIREPWNQTRKIKKLHLRLKSLWVHCYFYFHIDLILPIVNFVNHCFYYRLLSILLMGNIFCPVLDLAISRKIVSIGSRSDHCLALSTQSNDSL